MNKIGSYFWGTFGALLGAAFGGLIFYAMMGSGIFVISGMTFLLTPLLSVGGWIYAF